MNTFVSIFGFIYHTTKCLALFSPMKQKYIEIQKTTNEEEYIKVIYLAIRGKMFAHNTMR